jgi:hypothetical protein
VHRPELLTTYFLATLFKIFVSQRFSIALNQVRPENWSPEGCVLHYRLLTWRSFLCARSEIVAAAGFSGSQLTASDTSGGTIRLVTSLLATGPDPCK